MSVAILETTFLIDILRGREAAGAVLTELERRSEPLFVSAPSVMELWQGALESGVPAKAREKVDEFLCAMPVLPLDGEAARRAAEVLHELARGGEPIETEDAMIAGIAIVRGQTVVTRDAHFARVPGLRVLKY
ncbi:MAG: PIN domain-containing protein [Thermoplasmata archaeon]